MKRAKALIVLLAGVLLVAAMVAGGCGSSTKTTPTTTPKEVGNVTGESITVSAGQDFEVSLAENPTTGYSWSITTQPDAKVVKQKGESRFVQAPGSSGVMGAGGTEIWTFTGVAAGSTNIVFENRQAGSKDTDPPAWTHNVSVKVTAPPPTPAPAPKTYTDPKTPINETVGREFHINLSEQTASTGYKWLLNSGYNHSVCLFQGVKFISASSSAMGAAEVEVWRFLTKGKGTTKLTFNYVQPFDKNAAAAKTVTFTVNVN